MSLKHGLLGLLWNWSYTGYELDMVFRQSLNFFWQAQTSQVYRELSAMEEKGWITTNFIPQTDRPSKKECTITPAGRQELLRWLSEPDDDSDFRLRSSFMMRVFFSDCLAEDEFTARLDAFEEWNRVQLERLRGLDFYTHHGESRMERARYATVVYGEMYYQMNMDWCARMRAEGKAVQ